MGTRGIPTKTVQGRRFGFTVPFYRDAETLLKAAQTIRSGLSHPEILSSPSFSHPGNPHFPTTWVPRNCTTHAAQELKMSECEGKMKGSSTG